MTISLKNHVGRFAAGLQFKSIKICVEKEERKGKDFLD
jgi:hypothetical protein